MNKSTLLFLGLTILLGCKQSNKEQKGNQFSELLKIKSQIFIETPYRNNTLLENLIKTLDQKINLFHTKVI